MISLLVIIYLLEANCKDKGTNGCRLATLTLHEAVEVACFNNYC